METAEMTVSIGAILLLLISGIVTYFKGRSDESLKNLKEDFKKLSEYGKIDATKVSKDEAYKEDKW